jgi:hypothetical protein
MIDHRGGGGGNARSCNTGKYNCEEKEETEDRETEDEDTNSYFRSDSLYEYPVPTTKKANKRPIVQVDTFCLYCSSNLI